MPEKHIVTGVGGAVIGILAGVALGGSGTESKINAGMKRAFAPVETVTTELTDRIAVLEENAAASSAALGDAVSAGNEALSARIDDIEALLGNLEGGLADTLSAATQEQAAALQAGLADLKSGLGTVSAGGAQDSAGAGAAASAPVSDPSKPPEGLSAGETGIFGDVRVFVSRADAGTGMARLSIDGDLATLAVGEAIETDAGCPVTLAAVDRGHALIETDCGGPAMAASAMADEGEPVDGAGPGETVVLADGALRVFVSGVMGAQGARIAINGVETVNVLAGESVEVSAGDQTCTVTVEATGGGRAALGGSCG